MEEAIRVATNLLDDVARGVNEAIHAARNAHAVRPGAAHRLDVETVNLLVQVLLLFVERGGMTRFTAGALGREPQEMLWAASVSTSA